MDAEQLGAAAAKNQSLQRGRLVRQQKSRASAENNHKTARAQREAAATHEVASTVQSQAHSAAATKIQARIRGHQAKQRIAHVADGGAPLSCASITKGLHTLGRNPHTLRHCMIGCSLPALELSDIAAIAEYPLLQVIQLSNNHTLVLRDRICVLHV